MAKVTKSSVRFSIYNKPIISSPDGYFDEEIYLKISDAEKVVEKKVQDGDDMDSFIICEVIPVRKPIASEILFSDVDNWD